MKKKKIKCTSSKATGRCLYACGNEKNKKNNNTLNVSGTFEADVTLSGRKNDKGKVTAEIVVIGGKGVSLLGKETSEKVGGSEGRTAR